MNYFNCLVGFGLAFVLVQSLQGQDVDALDALVVGGLNQAFEVVVGEDGVKQYLPLKEVDPNSELGRATANARLRAEVLNINSPVNKLLRDFNPERIALAVENELTPDQQQSLEKLVQDFKRDSKGKNGIESFKLRKDCIVKFKSILLPEQLDSIRKFEVSRTGIFRFVGRQKVAKHLEIKESQLSEIENKCRLANKAVSDAILEQKRVLDKLRTEMDGIIGSLSEDQQKKLGKLLNKDMQRFFDNFDLQSMRQATEIPKEKL